MTEKEIREAIRVIVADVLFFNGETPLAVASRTQKITPLIISQSEGVKTLRKAIK